jgi:hypothetical protein
MLGARGLLWHGVVHTPEDHSDARNFHMHMVYHDRPAEWIARKNPGTRGDGHWLFARKKLPETREYYFIRRLREEFCDVVNVELKRARLERRDDPRTYAEMGIAKKPGVHLGGAAHALERAGVVTTVGTRNVGAELEYEILKLLAGVQRVLEAGRKQVGFALGAAEMLEGVDIPLVREKRQAVMEAAARFVEAALARARAGAHEAWIRERRDMMDRRPTDVALRGRDPAGRDEASRVTVALNQWWRPSVDQSARETRRAMSTLRRASRVLSRAEEDALAEGLLLERARALEGLRGLGAPVNINLDVSAGSTGQGSSVGSSGLSGGRPGDREWRAETLRAEERLRAAEHRWAKDMASARRLSADLGFEIGAEDMKTRARRRRLRTMLEEPGDAFGESAPPGPAGDLGRTLGRLDDAGSKIARLKGSLNLRKRAEAVAKIKHSGHVADQSLDSTEVKHRNQLAGGLRRRIDAIDHQIKASPTALSLVRKRGLEDRLFNDGELARNKNKPPVQGHEN